MTMRALRIGARFLYMLTRNKRFLAGSVLKFLNSMVGILVLPKITRRSVGRLPRSSTSVSSDLLTIGDFDFDCLQVTMKLMWVLENIPGLRQAADKGEVAFGGVDSWLLYKLTGKKWEGSNLYSVIFSISTSIPEF